ncbi:MAG: hypothetical protein COT73_07295 [Bdellovibrio sp. CG10_big_fil_rev_8_21_14_0_10_47_8]|nr:MAG: hypothetical protein COT73_07295 [Bdellovibrio sp. CG10_big_fil_rev_8_21_14_0_10_47_8]
MLNKSLRPSGGFLKEHFLPNPPKHPKMDFQTISLFLILGLLTAIVVFGARWALLTPIQSPTATVERASR